MACLVVCMGVLAAWLLGRVRRDDSATTVEQYRRVWRITNAQARQGRV